MNRGLRPATEELGRSGLDPVVRSTGHDAARATITGDDRTFKAIRDLVTVGEEVWITVTGRSMEPTLYPGDRVLLRRADAGWHCGRVVLSEFAGRAVLHRLMRMSAEAVTTAGDACRREDPPVRQTALIAEAVAVQSDRLTIPLLPTLRFGAWAVVPYLGARVRQTLRRAAWRAWAGLRRLAHPGGVA